MGIIRTRALWVAISIFGLLLAALVPGSARAAHGAARAAAPVLPADIPAGSVYVPVAPSRLLDTRIGLGAPHAAVGSHQSVTLQVTGGVVPGSATAVAVNVTVTGASAPGWVSVGPAPVTSSSNLNFVAGQTVPNLVVSQLSGSGSISLYNGSSGGVQLIADVQGYSSAAPLTVTVTGLHDGVAGLPYTEQLAARGGTEPYSWSATGLPAGLSVSADGLLSGTPTATGSAQVQLSATDSVNTIASASLSLSVPEALPPDCATQSCAQVSPDGQTVQVPATRVGLIGRDASGFVNEINLAGAPPSDGQILVIAPTADAPSGLIVVVNAVFDNGDGTSTVEVSPAGLADAYAQGTVKAVGSQSAPAVVNASALRRPARTAAEIAKAATVPTRGHPARVSSTYGPSAVTPGASAGTSAVTIDCDHSVTSELHGLSVVPSLTPTIAALWAHPFFGGGGIYFGTGGLSLFQFDLDGSITANLGITISGAATCTLTFPPYFAEAPAGPLGVALLEIDPSMTFEVTGKVDLRTSVTFECSAEYRWDQGQEWRLGFCTHHEQPLQLSADSGIDGTASLNMAASLTLDDFVGLDGDLTGILHAGYHPTQHPVAEIDGQITYDLEACLACFWDGTPAHVTIVDKKTPLFKKKILWSSESPPSPPPSTDPVITTTQLPSSVVGQPYHATLTTADNRQGTWLLTGGSLPDGLQLVADSITGKPLTEQTANFEITFIDSLQRSDVAELSITVLPGGTGVGAVQNLDYCRQNVFAANDDNSIGPVPLPFTLTFGGVSYSDTYVSNNGYVVFDGPRSTYTPFPLLDEWPTPIIAPFFADVDTRNPASALVTYGSSPDGKTFCVNWVGVGYYNQHVDKLNSFQLLLNDRSDVAPGDFDIVFNYGSMNWETGDASGGFGGIGGTAARAGYSAGTGLPGDSYELPGSGIAGALLEGEPDQLTASSQPAGQPLGRYILPIRN
jgi:hypothetical protein